MIEEEWIVKIGLRQWKILSRLQEPWMPYYFGIAHVAIQVIFSLFGLSLSTILMIFYEKVERIQTQYNGQRGWMERFGNKQPPRKVSVDRGDQRQSEVRKWHLQAKKKTPQPNHSGTEKLTRSCLKRMLEMTRGVERMSEKWLHK